MSKWYIAICSVLLIACANNTKPLELEEEGFSTNTIVGAWNANILEYTLNTETDSAFSDTVFVLDFPNRFGISGVRAIYNEDGSFSSTYIGLDGNDLSTETGEWYDSEDSLYVIYVNEVLRDTQAYAFEFFEDSARFETILDWDQDGITDDHLILHSLRAN